MQPKYLKLIAAVLFYFIGIKCIWGGVTQITTPTGFVGQTTTLTFDEYPDGTPAASLYPGQGITFDSDGSTPETYDWGGNDHAATVSSPNVLVRLGFYGYLDVTFLSPIYEIGAYVGNSAELALVWTLSPLDAGGQPIGTVSVFGNAVGNVNDTVDQFIGLRSDVPFYKARFDISDRAIAIDNLTFSHVSVLGDFNQNGVVDAADYTVWRNGLGSTYSPADYGVWKSHFGTHAGGSPGGAAGVPEPTSVVLISAGVTLFAVTIRRRSSVAILHSLAAQRGPG